MTGRAAETGEIIRVLVADAHTASRSGIRALLDSEPGLKLAAEAWRGEEAVVQYRSVHPDIALIDVDLPGMDGWDTSRWLTREFPGALVILVSMFSEPDARRRAQSAGALGFLIKTHLRAVLIGSLRAVYRGETAFFD